MSLLKNRLGRGLASGILSAGLIFAPLHTYAQELTPQQIANRAALQADIEEARRNSGTSEPKPKSSSPLEPTGLVEETDRAVARTPSPNAKVAPKASAVVVASPKVFDAGPGDAYRIPMREGMDALVSIDAQEPGSPEVSPAYIGAMQNCIHDPVIASGGVLTFSDNFRETIGDLADIAALYKCDERSGGDGILSETEARAVLTPTFIRLMQGSFPRPSPTPKFSESPVAAGSSRTGSEATDLASLSRSGETTEENISYFLAATSPTPEVSAASPNGSPEATPEAGALPMDAALIPSPSGSPGASTTPVAHGSETQEAYVARVRGCMVEQVKKSGTRPGSPVEFYSLMDRCDVDGVSEEERRAVLTSQFAAKLGRGDLDSVAEAADPEIDASIAALGGDGISKPGEDGWEDETASKEESGSSYLTFSRFVDPLALEAAFVQRTQNSEDQYGTSLSQRVRNMVSLRGSPFGLTLFDTRDETGIGTRLRVAPYGRVSVPASGSDKLEVRGLSGESSDFLTYGVGGRMHLNARFNGGDTDFEMDVLAGSFALEDEAGVKFRGGRSLNQERRVALGDSFEAAVDVGASHQVAPRLRTGVRVHGAVQQFDLELDRGNGSSETYNGQVNGRVEAGLNFDIADTFQVSGAYRFTSEESFDRSVDGGNLKLGLGVRAFGAGVSFYAEHPTMAQHGDMKREAYSGALSLLGGALDVGLSYAHTKTVFPSSRANNTAWMATLSLHDLPAAFDDSRSSEVNFDDAKPLPAAADFNNTR